jgi:hypothetical protein
VTTSQIEIFLVQQGLRSSRSTSLLLQALYSRHPGSMNDNKEKKAVIAILHPAGGLK